jgi:phospholipase C
MSLLVVALVAGGVGALEASSSSEAATRGKRITIHASHNPAAAFQRVIISGHVPGAHGGVHVTLWQRLYSKSRFRAVARARTTRGGRYLIKRRPQQNLAWYVVARRTRSRTLHERVHALVTLDVTTSSSSSTTVQIAGRVRPSHRGERISLQQKISGHWQRIARPRLNHRSRFSLSRTFASGSTVELRAFLRGDRKNIRSYSASVTVTPGVTGIQKIRHVVIIMQENRSFDSYFGTYPGADGIAPGVCVRDPVYGGCVKPFHDTQDKNFGGPHGAGNATADINGGKMNGFVAQSESSGKCTNNNPSCSPCRTSRSECDVMGYHNGADIPNYWTYAHDFVLQDHMFEPIASWSQPAHLYMVSEWSANCTRPYYPSSCKNAIESPNGVSGLPPSSHSPLYAWTDLTYLLHRYGVSWGYYVFQGSEPDCDSNSAITCAPGQQSAKTPSIWNPLPHFTDVGQDGQLGNIQTLSNFFSAAKAGSLPAVSWIDPNGTVSEHPPGLVSAGQTYVTGLINAIMKSPDWDSTAILLSWDDWGGFYDGVTPPSVDANGFGLRVPGMVISPYAKSGYIDHQSMSQDAYVKFIEDDFLGGARLDPRTDGRPDPRPDVRETLPQVGSLNSDFDFNQSPRPPVLLPVCPRTDLVPTPSC